MSICLLLVLIEIKIFLIVSKLRRKGGSKILERIRESYKNF